MERQPGRSTNIGIILAAMAIFALCFIGSLFATLVPPENENTPAPQASVIIKVGPSDVPATPTATEQPTSPPEPTNTLLVPEIQVREWKIRHICETRKVSAVEIVGADITGGMPPYWIEAQYENGTVIPREETISSDPLLPNKVELKSPMRVLPDKKISVSIKSTSVDGLPQWTDQWYFPSSDPNCQRSR